MPGDEVIWAIPQAKARTPLAFIQDELGTFVNIKQAFPELAVLSE